MIATVPLNPKDQSSFISFIIIYFEVHAKKTHFKHHLKILLVGATFGIKALMITYQADQHIQSTLVFILEHIAPFMKEDAIKSHFSGDESSYRIGDLS